jgi:hypothetical protein
MARAAAVRTADVVTIGKRPTEGLQRADAVAADNSDHPRRIFHLLRAACDCCRGETIRVPLLMQDLESSSISECDRLYSYIPATSDYRQQTVRLTPLPASLTHELRFPSHCTMNLSS